MDYPWIIHGYIHGHIHGYTMDYPWIIHGLSMDISWIYPWIIHKILTQNDRNLFGHNFHHMAPNHALLPIKMSVVSLRIFLVFTKSCPSWPPGPRPRPRAQIWVENLSKKHKTSIGFASNGPKWDFINMDPLIICWATFLV